MKDSIILHSEELGSEYSEFLIQINKENIILYDYIHCYVYLFDFEGRLLAKQFIHRSFDKLRPLSVDFFQFFNDSSIFFLKTLRFYHYSTNKYQHSCVLGMEKPDIEIRKKWGSIPAFNYVSESSVLILPICTYPNYLNKDDNRWLSLDYYRSPGLFAIFDFKPYLSGLTSDAPDTVIIDSFNIIGQRNQIYSGLKFIPHLDLIYWCFDEHSKTLFYSEGATCQITQIDLSGNIIDTFGNPGYYLNLSDTIQTITEFKKSRQEISIQLNTAKIQSPQYEELFLDDSTLYRIYSMPVKDDTDTIPTLNERYRKQGTLYTKKPRFLQIYSLTGSKTLKMDIQLPEEFTIYKIIDGIIYANSIYDSELKTLILYRFSTDK